MEVFDEKLLKNNVSKGIDRQKIFSVGEKKVGREAVCLCVHVYYIFKTNSSSTALENKLFLMDSIKQCPDRQQSGFTEICTKSTENQLNTSLSTGIVQAL